MTMRSFFARFDQLKPGFWPGVGCALLVCLLANLGLTRGVEKLALDTLFHLRGTRYADPRIVIIAVDNAAVVRAGERTGSGWPLPRRYYGRAVRELKALGAKTIAMDVLFSEAGPRLAEDNEFARECRRAGNVVQSCVFQIADKQAELSSDIDAGTIPHRFAVSESAFPRIRNAIWAAAPQPKFSSSAVALGHVNIIPEVSGTLRRIPHLLRWRGRLYPSLAMAAASQFLGEKPVVNARTSRVEVGYRTLPIDITGQTPVNWIGGEGSYPTYSLNQLLDGTVPVEAVRGRLVVIGVTAFGAFESRPTPFSNGIPAVDFQANAMDDIVSNRVLQGVSPTYTIIIAMGFTILCALVTARRAVGGFWPLPVLMLLLVGTGAYFLSQNLILQIGMALVGGFLSFAMTAAGGYRREWESSARADAAVASLARGTTRLGTVRDRERLLTIIRATARDTLNAREVYLLLDDGDDGDDPRAVLATQRAQAGGVGWIWPPSKPGKSLKRRRSLANYDSSTEIENALLAGETLVAAPLPRTRAETEETTDLALPKARLPREFCGALVAIGRRDGDPFTLRDAVLLETLAEGAAMALDNWRYSETLRGRIESANRELSGAYQLLAEQSAKLFAAVESIDAALVVCDADGLAAFVNPAGARILRGATPILGEPVASALEAGDLDELAQLFANWDTQGNATQSARLETIRGRDILVAQFTPLVSDEGASIGAMLVVSDVTAQRELDRMKTDFVGYVAHELRTPLTTILGYASLLDMSAGRFSPEEVRNMTGVISRHCRRMNGMISDLLDISRIESGAPLSIARTVFDIVPLCERLIEEQKPYLNPTPVFDFVLTCPQRHLEWKGDHDRLEQVMLNLLSNAIKYSPDGGTITVALSQQGKNVIVEVSDEGMGLSQQQCKQLFQKFYRTTDAQSRGIKGNGLGLNLVRQIIEAHGGEIEVSSQRDSGGKGATFRITLPNPIAE